MPYIDYRKRPPINVIQIGLGTIGRAITRALMCKQGIRIVGAVDTNPELSGHDLAVVTDTTAPSGVKVTADVSELFGSAAADVVLHAACTHLHEAFSDLASAAENGVNVISATETLGNPYVSDTGLAARIEKLAHLNGVTILGTGVSPGFTSDYLILAMTAGLAEVKQITYVRTADVRPYLGGTVAEHFGLGLSAEEFGKRFAAGEVIGHIGFVESAWMIAERLGWKLETVERSVSPHHDANGKFISTKTSVRGIDENGELRIQLELESSMAPDVETGDRFIIDAVPPVNMTIKPAIASVPATANAMVNAIPHVLNAPPGLMMPGDLPLVHALEGDARLMLR
jgi:4-hydroxy-tetrahydrodipicolinate reductase